MEIGGLKKCVTKFVVTLLELNFIKKEALYILKCWENESGMIYVFTHINIEIVQKL